MDGNSTEFRVAVALDEGEEIFTAMEHFLFLLIQTGPTLRMKTDPALAK